MKAGTYCEDLLSNSIKHYNNLENNDLLLQYQHFKQLSKKNSISLTPKHGCTLCRKNKYITNNHFWLLSNDWQV